MPSNQVVHCAVQVNGNLVTDLCTNIEFSGDYRTFSRSLSLRFMKPIDCSCGDNVRLNIDDREAFYGKCMSIDGDEKSMTIEALDNAVHLTKNRVNIGVVTKKPADMTKELCGRYGIQTNQIAVVDKAYNRKYMANTCADIIMDMYTMASRDNNKKYYPYFHANKLNILEFGERTCYYAIDSETALSAEFNESIESMINTIYYYENSDDTKASKTFKNDDDIKAYGVFSDVTTDKLVSDKDLKRLEENATVEVLGDIDFVTGRAVLMSLPNGLVGKFYITADTHTIKAGIYTTKLKLSFDKIMDDKDIGDITYNKVSDNSESGGLDYQLPTPNTGNNNGNTNTQVPYKRVPAIFTAYYPDNSGMQGGFYAANGEKLNPSSKTCAAPKSVNFGESIYPESTGVPSVDGVKYRVNDRGGAIVIDAQGYYHIDLLMVNATACNNFGRRKGYAAIGGYYNPGEAPGWYDQPPVNSSQLDNFIATLKKQLGKPYVWGATGPNSFDCSGLVQWSAKQVGKTISRTTHTQRYEGVSVGSNSIQKGDLVFFSSYTHVGVALDASTFIHAPNSSRPVSIDNLRAGYYSSRICAVRRLSWGSNNSGSGSPSQQLPW